MLEDRAPGPGAAESADASPVRVLVVEDNPADARLVIELLSEERGFVVAAAPRLAAALERLAGEPYDAVLLDLILPDGRGDSVLRAVSAAAPEVAIVVLTGLGDELDLARRAVAAGAQDFIPKSHVEPTLLRRALVTAIERCRLQRALERRERQLEEAQRLARIGDFWWQPGDRSIGLSRQLRGMIGCAESGVSLRALLRRADPPGRRSLLSALRDLHGAKECVELVLRLRAGAGELRDFRVEIQRRGPPAGRNTPFFGVCQDITEELAVARMKDEFVSVVSHELRTPLTCVLGSLSLLRGLYSEALPAAARELLDSACRNGERLAALVNDLLDLQRIASGRLAIEMVDVDYAALVREIVRQHEPCARGRGVHLRCTVPDVPVPGRTDPGRFGQMVGNLLANAIKFSPAEETVEVALEVPGDRVRLAVSDRGPGVPEALRERIFDRFVQVDSSDRRARQGTGLGLAIVRELAGCLDGRVGVEGRPGGGSVFWLELPCSGPGGRAARKRETCGHDDAGRCRDIAATP